MGKPRRVHPAPAQVSPVLPVAVAALAAALSPQEKDVLFYLLSAASGNPSSLRGSPQHSPDLSCGCFSCYKVFWERWDASPNRQVIHEIIEKVEANEEGGKSRRKSRRTRGKDRKQSTGLKNGMKEEEEEEKLVVSEEDPGHIGCNADHENYADDDGGCNNGHGDGCSDDDGCKPGVLGRFARFIGEKLLWAN